MKLKSLADVERALHPYYEVAAAITGKDVTVDRMKQLMAHLGNPERSLRIVHIAGTSGKTSTAYYVSALLSAGGQKTGLTVSPHVDSLNERVQINGQAMPEADFCAYMERFLERISDAPLKPSWFECMVAFAYWVFVEENVAYAVVETGLGGLHDATNIASRADKLCILTDIGFDHMHILGDRLGSIAHQKVGIVHEGNQLLMYEQSDEIMQVVRFWVSQQDGSELFAFDQKQLRAAFAAQFRDEEAMPQYQQRNWILAYAAYLFLARRDILPELSADLLTATQLLQVPGRMDAHSYGGKTILMDGAHNGQKMWAFAESLARKYPDRKFPVLLALKKGKEITDIAPILELFASKVIITTFTHTQDMPIESIEPDQIAKVLSGRDIACQVEADLDRAYRLFRDSVDDIGVITGSFYLISELRGKRDELK